MKKALMLTVLLTTGLFSFTSMAQRHPDRPGRGDGRLEWKVERLEREVAQLQVDQNQLRREVEQLRRDDRRDDRRGNRGETSCNWQGQRWLSHGWDGNCAWSIGAYVTCERGRVTDIQFTDMANGCRMNK